MVKILKKYRPFLFFVGVCFIPFYRAHFMGDKEVPKVAKVEVLNTAERQEVVDEMECYCWRGFAKRKSNKLILESCDSSEIFKYSGDLEIFKFRVECNK